MTAAAEARLAVIKYTPGDLPDSVPTAVYIARDVTGAVLYVGITGSLSGRFLAHKKADLWWSQAASIDVEMWPNRAAAKAREDQLIADIDPPHNRVEKWWRRGSVDLGERESVLIEMYGEGVALYDIASRMGITYSAAAAMVTRLRNEDRLGRRPRPPKARHWDRGLGAWVANA